MSRQLNIAIVGATGAVGETFLTVLAERNFPVKTLYLLASARSAGKIVSFKNQQLEVLDLAEFDFSKVDIALFSAGGSVSKEFAPKAVAAGCVVIDNTSCFR
ncbi:MAG: aspartate-semialdehyde dehydrogenase, partial [Gammaproteobacteria bacterium]|nr:aspartate-semialdehyde dehydrogenase [Gammaproteobacteria bacterium]